MKKKIQDARKCDLLVSIMTWVISYVCFCNSMFQYDKKISGKQSGICLFVLFVCLLDLGFRLKSPSCLPPLGGLRRNSQKSCISFYNR